MTGWPIRPFTNNVHFRLFSSLLPKVYNVDIPDWGPCSMLAMEAIRLAAVIVTVFHLLALAVNHYIGIARPLHYAGKQNMSRKSIVSI